VHVWLHAQPKTFLTGGIRKLLAWSNKCVERLGDYIEKITVYLFLHALCRIKKVIN
jgi:hypothetical protein